MNVRHVSVQEAHQLQTTDGYTYVDVRSVPEYENGHPKGAQNVPLMHFDSQTGRMSPNPEFLAVMQANFTSDAKLLIGCQVGGRSGRAVEILTAAGYEAAINVKGGFGGAPRPCDRSGGRRRLGADGAAGRDREPGRRWIRPAASERRRQPR